MNIGIIQGRLSPPLRGKIQSFPLQTWEKEFPMAKACGYNAIEWVFEFEGYEENPIWTDEGIRKIKNVSQEHQIDIPSICSDFFMKQRFFRTSPEERKQAVRVLKKLLHQGGFLGVHRILLPILEEAEIQTDKEQNELVACLRECFDVASRYHIELAIESNLDTSRYSTLMEQLSHPLARIYYDMGNRAAMGYDLEKDILTLRRWISGVHVKDRKRFGETVPLGEGDVNFGTCFRALRRTRFQGSYIVQGARGGEEVDTARRYFQFVKGHLEGALHEEHANP